MILLRQIFAELKWISFVLGRIFKSRALMLNRAFVRPKLPQNKDGKILIHLGCGDVNSSEFINVDTRPAPHIHYICDVTNLSIFQSDYADLIYACHVLEHVPHNSLKKTLWEWRRVLKSGGILRLSVPDFDKIIHIYRSCNNDINSMLAPLIGGQNYKYNFHCAVFNLKYLSDKLKEVGFSDIRLWNPDFVSNHNFIDWASMPYKIDGKEFPISLNLEATKSDYL